MKRNIITAFAAVVIAFTAFTLCGCTDLYGSIEGYSDVVKAKELYASLDSGHFYMQDNSTGKITEEFTFKYRSDGCLTYSYMGTDGDTVYYEFHNGSEINYRSGDETEWSYLEQSDENYYSYDRDNKHPYTTEGVISLNAYAVTDSTVEETQDGKKIIFIYDASQLADSLAELGELKSFESTVWLNEDGYCYRLDQKGVFENDGEKVSDYSMFIDMMDQVESLTRDGE